MLVLSCMYILMIDKDICTHVMHYGYMYMYMWLAQGQYIHTYMYMYMYMYNLHTPAITTCSHAIVGRFMEYKCCNIVGNLANIWKPTRVGNFQAGVWFLNCETTRKGGSTAMCWQTTFKSKKGQMCGQREWLNIWLPENLSMVSCPS